MSRKSWVLVSCTSKGGGRGHVPLGGGVGCATAASSAAAHSAAARHAARLHRMAPRGRSVRARGRRQPARPELRCSTGSFRSQSSALRGRRGACYVPRDHAAPATPHTGKSESARGWPAHPRPCCETLPSEFKPLALVSTAGPVCAAAALHPSACGARRASAPQRSAAAQKQRQMVRVNASEAHHFSLSSASRSVRGLAAALAADVDEVIVV
jgi:hypothetical protein